MAESFAAAAGLGRVRFASGSSWNSSDAARTVSRAASSASSVALVAALGHVQAVLAL